MRKYLEQGLQAPRYGPPLDRDFEHLFETAPGEQAQVDFAQFKTDFTHEPGRVRVVWLFSLVLGYSRWLTGRVEVDPSNRRHRC